MTLNNTLVRLKLLCRLRAAVGGVLPRQSELVRTKAAQPSCRASGQQCSITASVPVQIHERHDEIEN